MRNENKTVQNKLSNTIYIPDRLRQKLEDLTVATAFHRKRQISVSGFVQYLIEEFGEQAKDNLIAESIQKYINK